MCQTIGNQECKGSWDSGKVMPPQPANHPKPGRACVRLYVRMSYISAYTNVHV